MAEAPFVAALKDYLNFRNGKTSPNRSDGGEFPVFGANGPIGRSTESNAVGPFIVIGRVGSYCGSLHFSATDAWVTDNALICSANDPNETRYWHYALQMARLNERSGGSGQPLLNQSVLRGIELLTVGPQERLGIAQVLGALDDKIAADDRIATTALELADAAFEQAVSGASLGELTFADLAEIGGGGTPSTKVDEYWLGDVPWATPTDVTGLNGPYLRTTRRMITGDGLAACSSPMYPAGSILMTSRATIGAFAIAQVPTAVNQGFIVVNAREANLQWWLFHEMRSRVPEFISHANGATFLELSRGKFKQFRVHAPSPEQASAFAKVAGPLHELAAQSLQEATTLAATRDALLPLLTSGMVRVKDSETVVNELNT